MTVREDPQTTQSSGRQFRTKIRRRPDGTARWDVWFGDMHLAGRVEGSEAEAMRTAAAYLRANGDENA